jgi:hypothetical protein
MKSPRHGSTLGAVLALIAVFALPALCAAQVGNSNNGAQVVIPTLDGFGLATMAGALSIGGAWILSRRGRRK